MDLDPGVLVGDPSAVPPPRAGPGRVGRRSRRWARTGRAWPDGSRDGAPRGRPATGTGRSVDSPTCPPMPRPASEPVHDVDGPARRPDPDGRRARAQRQPLATASRARRRPTSASRRSSRSSPTARTTGDRPSDEGKGRWLAARGFALCRLDVRGTGSSPGIAEDEYTARETQDGYDDGRMAGRPAVVQRQRRDVGHLVWRLHGDPGRQAPSAAPPGDRPDVRHRRSLHRRRPLRRRLRHGQRAQPVRGEHGRDERPAGPTGVPRRRPGATSGASASSGRRSGCSSGSVSSTTARTGGRARWLRTTTGSRPPTFLIAGWMDGYVDPALRMLERCVNAPRKAIIGNWVHDYPDDGLPRPEPRLAPRVRPVLRPLAQGHRQRGRWTSRR